VSALHLRCDLHGRILHLEGSSPGVAPPAPGATLASIVADGSAGRVLDLLLATRQEGWALATRVQLDGGGAVEIAGWQGESGLELLLAADAESLARALAPVPAGPRAALSALLAGQGATDWQSLLAERDAEIARLRAELERLRGA
jgi:hypothetical protein